MQIKSVSVKNFKSLVDTKITKCTSVNLIHGYNNCGKSNFLKFLEILFKRKTIESFTEYEEFGELHSRRQIDQVLPFYQGYIYNFPYAFTKDNRDEDITFEVTIELDYKEIPYVDDLKAATYLPQNRDTINVTIGGRMRAFDQDTLEMVLTSVELSGISIYDSENKFFSNADGNKAQLSGREDIGTAILDLFNDCIVLVESNRFFGHEKLEYDNKTPLASENFKRWLHDLNFDAAKFQKYKQLVEFVNKFKTTSAMGAALDENLKSFPFTNTKMGFAKFNDELEVMLENTTGRYPLKNFGTGVQQIFFILSKIFDTTSKIVLIEELELNLSPEYQELVINNLKLFVDEDKRIHQVFFTSHSDYLFRKDFHTYEVSIDGDGKSTIKRTKFDAAKKLIREYMYHEEEQNN